MWENRVQDKNTTSFELQELACRDKFPRKFGKDGSVSIQKHDKFLYCFSGTEFEKQWSARKAFSAKLLI